MTPVLLLSAGIALSVATATFGIAHILRSRGARRTRGRLEEISRQEEAAAVRRSAEVLDADAATAPELDARLQQLPGVARLHLLLQEGDIATPVGKFLGIMVVFAVVAGALAAQMAHTPIAALIAGPAAGAAPVFFAVRKKRQRLAAFEKNFADALDILTAALRAGLAFSGAVQVVSEESPDPISKEFGIVFEENRLGLDMKEALRNLAARVASAELRMFVTAVILQRETGGNLTEILEQTAAIIRDRFRILGEVRALTAQQRFSGVVLSILPLVMGALLLVTAPDYMRVLVHDPWGPYLIIGAMVMQIVGYLAIRWIVAIKV